MFQGICQIGKLKREVVAPFETQGDHEVCVLYLDLDDIFEHWAPGSVVELKSFDKRDQISVLSSFNGRFPTHGSDRIPSELEMRIPSVFEVVRKKQ
ncbi:hypothetical protein [Ruegeria sp. HKCCA5491]|uniref:hypothetical protein n=1 Tax=Ruegeria sp. HKCCA5491 TaxID=2682986 RepID=UPI001488EE3A|nr:hypothetical protein [Ruegeria sp. HKCCA5491]